MIKKAIFYIKARNETKNIIKKIKRIDNSFSVKRLRLELTNTKHKAATISIKNKKKILKLSSYAIDDDFIMKRIITHELVHLWIGPDLRTGVNFFPQHIKGIDKHFGIYKDDKLSLRMQLCCFIYQQFKFKNRFTDLAKLDNYNDPLFHNHHNPYVNLEEILVNYVVMKLWDDDIEHYPFLKKIFKEDKVEKEILMFMDDVMPNVRLGIKKLVEEF